MITKDSHFKGEIGDVMMLSRDNFEIMIKGSSTAVALPFVYKQILIIPCFQGIHSTSIRVSVLTCAVGLGLVLFKKGYFVNH